MKYLNVILALCGMPLGVMLSAWVYSEPVISHDIDIFLFVVGIIMAGGCFTYLFNRSINKMIG